MWYLMARRDYVGGFLMEEGSVSRIQLPEGYLSPGGTWHAYIADYQAGNLAVLNTTTGRLEQLTDYYPYGMPHATATNPVENRYKYSGKELTTTLGFNAYDFAARLHSPAFPHFLQPDPYAESYHPLSPYTFCASDPINFTDPTGEVWQKLTGEEIGDTKNIRVFIFYSSDFQSQAKVQYQKAEKEYGIGTVALSKTSTVSSFLEDWKNMSGKDIKEVLIMTHGKNQSINLGDDAGREQLTSTGTSATNISNRKAYNVQNLPKPRGDLSGAELNLYTCHSADKEPKAHGQGVHRQGPLLGSKQPIAYAFAQYFNFKSVKGTKGAVNYNSLLNNTSLFSENYYMPYPEDKKWIIIINGKN